MTDKIKNLIFDLGGVVITIDYDQAVRAFESIGLKNARKWLDPYTQGGIFGDVERGTISGEEFRKRLGEVIGREMTWDECRKGWQGYLKDVPQRNLEALIRLRKAGYRLILLSNTNPFMMEWAFSDAFDGKGHSINDYFDTCYVSYKCKFLKPDKNFFRYVLDNENIKAEESLFIDDGPRNTAAAQEIGLHTMCPENGSDWTKDLFQLLEIGNNQ